MSEQLDFFDNAFDHEKARKEGVILPRKGVFVGEIFSSKCGRGLVVFVTGKEFFLPGVGRCERSLRSSRS